MGKQKSGLIRFCVSRCIQKFIITTTIIYNTQLLDNLQHKSLFVNFIKHLSKILISSNKTMPTSLPMYDKLAKVANSRRVKDVMLVHYWDEVKKTVGEESDLMAKATEIKALVDRRVKTIEDLNVLAVGIDSAVETIKDMKRMNNEDLCFVEKMLFDASQKRVRIRNLVAFIEKLEKFEY